jgi:nucleotide-binding universal stress UspA family protein
VLIAHTTDLSGGDEIAFEHALALAAQSGSRLVSVHASVGPAPERKLPEAAALLARWGVATAIEHECITHHCCDDAVDTLLDALRKLAPDLTVSATHARSGIDRVLGSVAEGVARNLVMPTLLLPLDGKRFVDARTGALRLNSLLVPAGSTEEAQQAIGAAALLTKLADLDSIEVILLHVVDGRPIPEPELPAGFRLRLQAAEGELEGAILDAADLLGVDALVMVTRGHDAMGDVLLGSHTERVLHQCRRPVLWVPFLKH